jgi:hypothetical protein
MKPICCNHGCESTVAYSRNGKPTAFCSSCTMANSTGNYKFGVLPIKLGYCSNYNGDIDLGFKCPTNYKIIESNPVYKKSLELDHLDGNHANNKLKNLCPLCPICHATKGSLFKDNNSWKNYANR